MSLSIIPLGVSGQLSSDATSIDSTSYSSGSGYSMTLSYSITGGGSPTAPTINYVTKQGDSVSKTIPLYPSTQTFTMAKNKPWSVTPNPLVSSTSDPESERWISTQTLYGITPNSGSTTKKFTFQHQYYLKVSSPYDTPTGEGWYNSGTTAYAQLSRSTVWDPTGVRYVFVKWDGAASGTNLKSNPITIPTITNAPEMIATAVWKTQYKVSFAVNPDSGSTTPSGSNYYDSGLNLQITANPSGNHFVAWTQTGAVTLTGPASQTTNAIINGPGTITANFDMATQKPTHLTIQCEPSQTGLNLPVTLTGLLTDSNNNPLRGKTVFLTFTTASYSMGWTSINQVTTENDGTYEISWACNLPVGAYFVMAQFPGDYNHKCSSAVASNNGTSLTVIPEYGLGTLAAIGACFAGFAVIKKRNTLHF
jgi:hypothetical protein